MTDEQRDSDKVLHQDAVEDVAAEVAAEVVGDLGPGVTDDQLAATSDHAAIDDLEAPSETYVEAEAVAAVEAINEILAVLRDAELIPESA